MLAYCASFFSTSDQPEEDFVELLDKMVSVAKAHGVALSPQEEFHLSVSQTVVLRHHWIQPFTRSLRTGLTLRKRFLNIKQDLETLIQFYEFDGLKTLTQLMRPDGSNHVLHIVLIVRFL